ncbi:MAG: hydrogenase [Elusimicrobiota bacterium]
MIKEILTRIKQGYRTLPFPFEKIKLSERYKGYPKLDFSNLKESEIEELLSVCPCSCIYKDAGKINLDLGNCTFCGICEKKLPQAVKFSKDRSMAFSSREDLILSQDTEKKSYVLREEIRKLFGRSLKLRQVSAGGCNACEADCNVLGTPAFDMGRFGIQFVASPRHADGILITGPVSENMYNALIKTYRAVPDPKIAIAVGACAVGGGIYRNLPKVKGIPEEINIDLYIPGCPPNPITILDALLRFIGRIK